MRAPILWTLMLVVVGNRSHAKWSARFKKCNQIKCPVNCDMSEWSGWSKCTADCEGGVQGHTRSILTKPKNGGEITLWRNHARATPCPATGIAPWHRELNGHHVPWRAMVASRSDSSTSSSQLVDSASAPRLTLLSVMSTRSAMCTSVSVTSFALPSKT